ncbi:MAG: SET domain-containing protein [Saprospiraceae bacterium]
MKILPHIYIAHTTVKGRGVFTALEIPEGSPIEICPLILVPSDQTKLIDQTALYDYYFIWDQDHLALALGYGSLYNHSRNPNAVVIYDYETLEIQIKAIQDIAADEEIVINYHDDETFSGDLWFEEK